MIKKYTFRFDWDKEGYCHFRYDLFEADIDMTEDEHDHVFAAFAS